MRSIAFSVPSIPARLLSKAMINSLAPHLMALLNLSSDRLEPPNAMTFFIPRSLRIRASKKPSTTMRSLALIVLSRLNGASKFNPLLYKYFGSISGSRVLTIIPLVLPMGSL